jgi:hypothetical protein
MEGPRRTLYSIGAAERFQLVLSFRRDEPSIRGGPPNSSAGRSNFRDLPATIPATLFGWLSIKYALGIVLSAVFLIFALSLLIMLPRTPRAQRWGNRPAACG